MTIDGYENPSPSLSFPRGTVRMKTMAQVYMVIERSLSTNSPCPSESGMASTYPEPNGGFGPRYYHFLAKCSCVTH